VAGPPAEGPASEVAVPGAAELTVAGGLLATFAQLVEQLRQAGVPVSTTEVLDATEALRHLPLEDREALKSGLGAALVKEEGHRQAFDRLFELYFSLRNAPLPGAPSDGEATGDAGLSPGQLAEMALRALTEGDDEIMSALARAAVHRYAGMEAGRPVGDSYYVFKTLRQLETEGLLARLLQSAQETGDLEGLALADEYRRRMARLRRQVEQEVRRRLVEDRGAEAVAHQLRRPLPEDLDFMHLGAEELAALQRTVQPLARKLAVHLARKRRRHRHGPLDFRATVRRSLSTGGVPVEPRFRSPQRSKPELWALADVSGSVAAFARFTLQLVYALSSEFSRTRAWAFIDGVDEVTDLLKDADDISHAVHLVNTEADVVWSEGHSDYGHALSSFVARWGRELNPRATVVVLGDARNNYHPVEAWALAEVAKRCRHLWWLNPEPRPYWDTGDSVLNQYAVYCEGVWECRNLRQLRHFIEQLP
jgi:uncharacterized protein